MPKGCAGVAAVWYAVLDFYVGSLAARGGLLGEVLVMRCIPSLLLRCAAAACHKGLPMSPQLMYALQYPDEVGYCVPCRCTVFSTGATGGPSEHMQVRSH